MKYNGHPVHKPKNNTLLYIRFDSEKNIFFVRSEDFSTK